MKSLNRFISYSFVSALLGAVIVLNAAASASAQVRSPQPSQKASVMQTIGVTDISITYSRPGVKGRTIWGEAPKDVYAKGEETLDNQNKRPEGMAIVPYGHLWRTGANNATTFEVTDDVMINGKALAAGKYSLHTIPGAKEWTVIFNKDDGQWGSFRYDAAKDALRVTAKPVNVADSQEWMSFSIDPTAANAAQVTIAWEKVRVPFTVEIKDVAAVALAKARMAVESASSDDWKTPMSAAGLARDQKAMTQAGEWIDRAVSAIDVKIKADPSFVNLAQKATILRAGGRDDDASKVEEMALAQGKAEGVDTSKLEKEIADRKAKKE